MPVQILVKLFQSQWAGWYNDSFNYGRLSSSTKKIMRKHVVWNTNKCLIRTRERKYLGPPFIQQISKARTLTHARCWAVGTQPVLFFGLFNKKKNKISGATLVHVMYEKNTTLICGYLSVCLRMWYKGEIASRQTSHRWKETWLGKAVPARPKILFLALSTGHLIFHSHPWPYV